MYESKTAKEVEKYFFQRCNVIVRFLGKRDYYIGTYRYVKKDDKEVYHSVIAQLFKVYHHQRQKCGLLIISKGNRMFMLVVLHAVTSCKKIREDDCLILTLHIF